MFGISDWFRRTILGGDGGVAIDAEVGDGGAAVGEGDPLVVAPDSPPPVYTRLSEQARLLNENTDLRARLAESHATIDRLRGQSGQFCDSTCCYCVAMLVLLAWGIYTFYITAAYAVCNTEQTTNY